MSSINDIVWSFIDAEDWDGDTSVDVLIGALQALVDEGKITTKEVYDLIEKRAVGHTE